MGPKIYWLTIIGSFFLVTVMWRKEAWKRHPAFFAYLCFCCIRSYALWCLFSSTEFTELRYARSFLFWQLAALPFLAAAVGELFGQKAIGAICGGAVTLTSALLIVSARAMMATGDLAGAVANSNPCPPGTAPLLWNLSRYRVTGGRQGNHGDRFRLGRIGGSIAMHSGSQFVSTYSWIPALFLWLGFFANYKAKTIPHLGGRNGYFSVTVHRGGSLAVGR